MKKLLFYTFIIAFSFKATNAQQWTNYTNTGVTEAITIDSLNNLWFGGGRSITKFDGNTWTTYLNHYVWAITIDVKGNIWAGTDMNGLYKYNGTQWVHYTTEDGLVAPTVYSIAIDASGNKWLGAGDMSGNGGVSKFDGTNFTNYTAADGLLSGNVCKVAIDHQGNEWFCSTNGISKFNGTNWTNYDESNGLAYKRASSILVDKSGNIWVGNIKSGGAGPSVAALSKFNGINWTTINGFSAGSIWDIVEDNSGNIWMATDEGVLMYNGQNWKKYTTSDGLISNYVYCIAIDHLGNKWFGTYEGVSKFCESFSVTNLNSNINTDIQIFPNPASDFITVYSPGYASQRKIISVKNILGQEVYMENTNFDKQQTINISKLKRGTYFLSMTINNKSLVRKFIKIE